ARRPDKKNDPPESPLNIPVHSSKKSKKASRQKDSPVIIEGDNDYQFSFAQCCNQLPGQAIAGFITRGRGVTIHRKVCRNLPRTLDMNPDTVNRLRKARWNPRAQPRRIASYRIVAEDRVGLLYQVAEVISQRGINM